ncbi:MAG: hypothetical protein ACP5JE_04685 [Thermoplasmata archaeon]
MENVNKYWKIGIIILSLAILIVAAFSDSFYYNSYYIFGKGYPSNGSAIFIISLPSLDIHGKITIIPSYISNQNFTNENNSLYITYINGTVKKLMMGNYYYYLLNFSMSAKHLGLINIESVWIYTTMYNISVNISMNNPVNVISINNISKNQYWAILDFLKEYDSEINVYGFYLNNSNWVNNWIMQIYIGGMYL